MSEHQPERERSAHLREAQNAMAAMLQQSETLRRRHRDQMAAIQDGANGVTARFNEQAQFTVQVICGHALIAVADALEELVSIWSADVKHQEGGNN